MLTDEYNEHQIWRTRNADGYQSGCTLAMGCLFSRGKRMNRIKSSAIAAVTILCANVTFIAAAYASITAD